MAGIDATNASRMWTISLPVVSTAQEQRQQQRMPYCATLRRAQTFAASYQPNALLPQLKRVPPPNSALTNAVGLKFCTSTASRDQLADHQDAVRHLGVVVALQMVLDTMQDNLCQCAIQQAVSGHSDMAAMAEGSMQARCKPTPFAKRVAQAHEQLLVVLWSQWPENYTPNGNELSNVASLWSAFRDRQLIAMYLGVDVVRRCANIQQTLAQCINVPLVEVVLYDGSSKQYYKLQVQNNITVNTALKQIETAFNEVVKKLDDFQQQVEQLRSGATILTTTQQGIANEDEYGGMLLELPVLCEAMWTVHQTAQVALRVLVSWNRTLQDNSSAYKPLYSGNEVWKFLQFVRDRLATFTHKPYASWKLDRFESLWGAEQNKYDKAVKKYKKLTTGKLDALLPTAIEQANRWCVSSIMPVQCVRLSNKRMQFERTTRLSRNHGILQQLTHVLRVPRHVRDFQRAFHPAMSHRDIRSIDDGAVALDAGLEHWEMQWQALVHVYDRVMRQFIGALVRETDGVEVQVPAPDQSANPGETQAQEERQLSEEEKQVAPTAVQYYEQRLQTLETLMCAALVKSGLFSVRKSDSTFVVAHGGATNSTEDVMDVFTAGSAAQFGPLYIEDADEQLEQIAMSLAPPSKAVFINSTAVVHELRQLVHDANVRLITHAQSLGKEPCVQWRHVMRDRDDTDSQSTLVFDTREHLHTLDDRQYTTLSDTTTTTTTTVALQNDYEVHEIDGKVLGSTQPYLMARTPQWSKYHLNFRTAYSSTVVNQQTFVPVFLRYFVALRNTLHALVYAIVAGGTDTSDIDQKTLQSLLVLDSHCPGSIDCGRHSRETSGSTEQERYENGRMRLPVLHALRNTVFDITEKSEWAKYSQEMQSNLQARQRDLVTLMNQACMRRAAHL